MSYSEWSDFAYYNTGDIATYNTIAYQALQANTNVIPTTLAPNWVVLPSGGGGGVSSLSGGTGALTQSCLNGTYTLIGNDIQLAIAYPVQPQLLPTLQNTGPALVNIPVGGAQFPLTTGTCPYSFVAPTKCVLQFYFYADGEMLSSGGNDLFVIDAKIIDNNGGVPLPSVATASVYVDSQNKPTGFDCVLTAVAQLDTTNTIAFTITGQSTLTGDDYQLNVKDCLCVITPTA